MIAAPLIELRGVSKCFAKPIDLVEKLASTFHVSEGRTVMRAVDGVDLRVSAGEAVGLVGESGCGKSTLGRIIAGLCEPSEGTVLLHGVDRTTLAKDERRRARLAIQMIFQDSYASLDPRCKVREIVGEAPRIHGLVARANLDGFIETILQSVGLDPTYKWRYPHQLSGGQRQRIGIARALAVSPEFIVCDEPAAALDVSIQAQIINLFIKLREDTHLSYLFISHDLGVIEHVADRIFVMYLGRIIESAPTEALFAKPNHPYTQALLGEVPRFDQRRRQFAPVKGEIPSSFDPPAGCYFHPRCPHAMDRCRTESPVLKEISSGRASACHLNDRA
jgi:peptide/nickel transport system ATP-binding protein